MTMRIGTKGQVVIPKPFRDQLGLHPGDEVDWAVVDGTLTIERVESDETLRGRYAGLSLVDSLEEDRRQERNR